MNLQLWQIGLLLFAGVVIGGVIQLVWLKIKADRASKAG